MKSVVHKLVIVILIGLIHSQCLSQTVIQMEEYGGLYRIPCKVNGAKMKLIFDTGADKVCLSLFMANYLYDNDYITDEDIVGSGATAVADGSIVNHIKINIKDIEIQGIHLKNVEAIVMDGQDAPLLLGQSAIKKLGKYSISGNKLIFGSNNTSNKIILSQQEIDSIESIAFDAARSGYYNVSVEQYGILYKNDYLTSYGKKWYAWFLQQSGNYEDALEIYLSIQNDIEEGDSDEKTDLYYSIANCYFELKIYDKAIPYYEKTRYNTSLKWEGIGLSSVLSIYSSYTEMGNYNMAQKVVDDNIYNYLKEKGFKRTDCWELNKKDEILGLLYSMRAFAYSEYYAENHHLEIEYYLILSAAWGYDKSISYCNKVNIDYWSNSNIIRYK